MKHTNGGTKSCPLHNPTFLHSHRNLEPNKTNKRKINLVLELTLKEQNYIIWLFQACCAFKIFKHWYKIKKFLITLTGVSYEQLYWKSAKNWQLTIVDQIWRLNYRHEIHIQYYRDQTPTRSLVLQTFSCSSCWFKIRTSSSEFFKSLYRKLHQALTKEGFVAFEELWINMR